VSDVQVTHHEDQKRYEARVDGELAGSAYYDAADDLVVFTHTEVDEAFEGHGVGSALARAAQGPRLLCRNREHDRGSSTDSDPAWG
jgi:predicted GNAT family acetyltransferase